MKKMLAILLLSSFFCVFSAEKFTRSEGDLLKMENQTFGLAFWTKDWKNCAFQHSNPACINFPGEGAANTPLGLRRHGIFQTPYGKFEYTETIKKISDTEQNILLKVNSAEGIPTALLTFKSALIPLSDYVQRPVRFNGEKVLPKEKKEFFGRIGKQKNRVVIPLERGILSVTGDFLVRIPRFSSGMEIRFCFTPCEGVIKNAVLELHMKYEPYPATKVNLRSGVNMGFADEVDGDGKGGWTDQGAKNDLRSFPTGTREFAGIPFDIIDPNLNRGKSCLALRGKLRPTFAKAAKFSISGAHGRYLYILNAVGWEPKAGTPAGKVRIHYDDGTADEQMVLAGRDTGNFWEPFNGDKRIVAWKGRNLSAPIGLYITTISLNPLKNVVAVEFLSMDQVWMIVAATITDRIPEKETQVVMRPNKDWIYLDSATSVEKGSIADFSFLTDAPAGKYGFLKTNGEHFEFEKRPGIPVRFWGTNLCFNALYSKPEYTVRVLDDLLRNGCNTVRLHHFDGILTKGESISGSFQPERWRQLDFFVAEAKKRGLYITLDLFTSRHEAVQMKYGNLSGKDYKALCYFDKEIRNDFFRFAETLFNHVNPYTGTAWRDEPAIILLNLINEGTLTRTTSAMSPRVQNVVETRFKDFLVQKGLRPEPLHYGAHWQEFLAETGKEFFADAKRRLRLKIPLSDQNFYNPALDTRTVYDYVDAHLYWAHPQFIGRKAWSLPKFTTTKSAISAWGGMIGSIAAQRILGKPMTITEWNHCYPNPTYFDGPFLIAAYSALQDFGGLWQFAYSHQANFYFKPGWLGAFDFCNNPVLAHAMRLGALIFLRGDVAPASITLAFSPDAAEAGRAAKLALQTKIGLCWKKGPTVNAEILLPEESQKTEAPRFFAKTETGIARALKTANLFPESGTDFSRGSVRSTTEELMLNAENNTFCVATLRSESLLGPANSVLKGKVISAKNRDAFAAVSLASVDGLPLSGSKRLLLLHLTENKSEGAVFRDSSMSVQEKSGNAKQLLRRNQAEVQINLRGNFQVYACSGTGKRLFEVPVQNSANGFSLTLDNASASGGVLVYELIRE